MKMIDYIKLRIVPVVEPEIGTEIYYIANKDSGILEPCIVKEGCYLDPVYHRASNFWTWLNLATGKEEKGYGGFVKIMEAENLGYAIKFSDE